MRWVATCTYPTETPSSYLALFLVHAGDSVPGQAAARNGTGFEFSAVSGAESWDISLVWWRDDNKIGCVRFGGCAGACPNYGRAG